MEAQHAKKRTDGRGAVDLDQLEKLIDETLAANQLVPTEVWTELQDDSQGERHKQRALIYAAAAAFSQGVHAALALGASPFEGITQWMTFEGSRESLLLHTRTAFWWGQKGNSKHRLVAIKSPFQAAIAGRCNACLRLLLNPRNFAEGFAWFTSLELDLRRLDAGLELLQAVHGRAEEREYGDSIRCWLETAERWVNSQNPDVDDCETQGCLTLLHHKLSQCCHYHGKTHTIPASHWCVFSAQTDQTSNS